MWKTREGSTGRLIQLCIGYFVFYVITGVAVKYYLGKGPGFPAMSGIEYMVYSTAGGNLVCMAWVLYKGWYRLKSDRLTRIGPWLWQAKRAADRRSAEAGGRALPERGLLVPRELWYIIPSGVCTAVVIPTTTLMYTLPISVMVAMVIMRGSVIVISRVVDAVQIRQGILHKKVYGVENWAVVFALAAVAVNIFFNTGAGGFDFIRSPAAVAILGSYLVAYLIRIYIMNYYKNTRPAGSKNDNEGFFGVEQIAAAATLLIATAAVLAAPSFGLGGERVQQFGGAFTAPRPEWLSAIVSGMAFGVVAFFSVFIFMFKGRTATFAGLVNRLTSLVAGTASTLIFAAAYGGKMPKSEDWLSLLFILVSVAFLTMAERKRSAELGPAATAPAEPASVPHPALIAATPAERLRTP